MSIGISNFPQGDLIKAAAYVSFSFMSVPNMKGGCLASGSCFWVSIKEILGDWGSPVKGPVRQR